LNEVQCEARIGVIADNLMSMANAMAKQENPSGP
jgi:hypothetical protein